MSYTNISDITVSRRKNDIFKKNIFCTFRRRMPPKPLRKQRILRSER